MHPAPAPAASPRPFQQILQQRGEVDSREWRFLLAGPGAVPAAARSSSDSGAPPQRGASADARRGGGGRRNPGAGWLTDNAWGEVLALSRLPAFAGFDAHVAEHVAHYRALFDSAQARAERRCAAARRGRRRRRGCC